MKRILFLLAACTLMASTTFAQKSRTTTSCPPDITNLQVAFDDTLGNLFTSDGLGVYVTRKTKSESIDIKFQRSNCSYDFTMNLSSSKRVTLLDLSADGMRTSTFFNFDRIASVPITDWNNAAFRNFCGNTLNSSNVVKNADGTYLYDNYGGCGQDADGKYFVRRAVGIQPGTSEQGFRFSNSPLDGISTLASDTSYIRVYHSQQFVWELSPEFPSRGLLFNKNPESVVNYHNVPFRITVTQLN